MIQRVLRFFSEALSMNSGKAAVREASEAWESFPWEALPLDLQYKVMALACGSWSLEQILSVLQTMPLLVRVIDQTIPMEFLRRDLYDGVNKKKLDGSTLTPAFDEVLFLAGFTQVHKHARIQACLHIVRLKYRFEQQFLGEGGLYDDQTSSYREPDKPWENRSWQRIELRRMMVALVPFPLHFKNYVRHFMDILQFLGNSEEEIHSAMLQDVQRQDLGY